MCGCRQDASTSDELVVGRLEALRVCLDENLPPPSVHHRGEPASGFDVELAQAVAERLGRSLEIQWFESKLDEDSSPALEANALLSDRRCSLVGSYALTTDSLVALADVNKALSALQADGTVAKLAEAAGVSFLPPREPIILGDAMLRALHPH